MVEEEEEEVVEEATTVKLKITNVLSSLSRVLLSNLPSLLLTIVNK